ncbi:MAG TPA: hypothetical protein VGR66_08160 [Candidatus Eisenbacteria bacterium]|jgi:hypothetical protein|nr:hypothetical protein [Candidatus Eisenbacteria bacterium]
MRTLYFDIDGTVLRMYTPHAKPALAKGALGRAVREAGIEKLVCIGNYCEVAYMMQPLVENFDPLGSVLEVCSGVFDDDDWFRTRTRLIRKPDLRAAEVDLTDDWWYMDDLAEKYFADAGRAEVYRTHAGSRILVPSAEGDGEDVLAWIRKIGRL